MAAKREKTGTRVTGPRKPMNPPLQFESGWPDRTGKGKKQKVLALAEGPVDLTKSSVDRTMSKVSSDKAAAKALEFDDTIVKLIHGTLIRTGEIFIIPEHLLPIVQARMLSMNSESDQDTVSYMIVPAREASFIVITKYRTAVIAVVETTKLKKGGYGKSIFNVGQYVGMLTTPAFTGIMKESAEARSVKVFLNKLDH